MNDMPKPTLLLIDGHSLAFRAFYALSPDNFRAPSGQHTNAVHGFISMLLSILQVHKPTHLAVAFDLSRHSFRTDEYPEYKGTRGETPPEFAGQTEVLHDVLSAMNIRTVTRENFEADDIIASLADQGADAGYRVLVVSGDRDTFQLISENTTILYPVKGVLNLSEMDDKAVHDKYGVHAKQYPDLAALVGETSDNLPGIPGVGPKTAAKWIQQYGSLQSIFDAADEISGKVGESLREHMQLAVRNRKLNHLLRDMKFDFGFDDLLLDGIDVAKVQTLFKDLGFRTLTEKVLRSPNLGKVGNVGDVSTDLDTEVQVAPKVRETLVPPAVQTLPASELEVWLKENHGTTGFAVEFTGTTAEQAIAVQFGFATETQIVEWSPANAHEVSSTMGEWLRSAEANKAMHGSKLAARKLLAQGIELAEVQYDIELMAYLLDPVSKDFSLDNLAQQFLDFEVDRGNPNELMNDKSNLGLDAWLALLISEQLYPKLQAEGQVAVLDTIESPSAKTLAQMEHVGVKVDKKLLEKMFDETSVEVNSIAKKCFDIIGREINLSSPKQLQTIIFDELGMTGTKSIKTGFSTNAAALAELNEQTPHPFLDGLLEHREVTKIRQMIETLLKSISADDRIHTTYSQTGTSTGRLSSENPNLQNIPIKSDRGKQMRSAFIATEGFETLLTADYSQIEMRIMAHLSGDEGLIEAFNTGEDLHKFVGARIFGVTPNEVTSSMRSKVKAMSYGLVYGLSEYGLAKQLRISNQEAKQLMADYFARFGGVKRYLSQIVDTAKQDGYTVTTFGRRRPFDDLNSKIFQVRENARRAALNAPIQGTAADIMKLAMVRIDKEMKSHGLASRMLLQVHDELVFEISPGELSSMKSLVLAEMQGAVELSVPLEVHIGVGQNWDAASH